MKNTEKQNHGDAKIASPNPQPTDLESSSQVSKSNESLPSKENSEEAVANNHDASNLKQNPEATETGEVQNKSVKKAKEKPLPKAVMLIKHFVLPLKMPGQDAHVTTYFREAQKVYAPETIQHLIENNAPIVAIE